MVRLTVGGGFEGHEEFGGVVAEQEPSQLIVPEFVMPQEFAAEVQLLPSLATQPPPAAPIPIAVQGPQLLPSFDSVMVPVSAPADLSAQTRIYQVPADGNAYENVAFLEEPAGMVAVLWVPMSVAFAPPEEVARWKSVVNAFSVLALPEFEMVEENVVAVPAVALVGVGAEAVRSGLATGAASFICTGQEPLAVSEPLPKQLYLS